MSMPISPTMTNPQTSKAVITADNISPYNHNNNPILTTPGRYVVTLRATDMGGSGLYTEYDLPIHIFPAWNPQDLSTTNSNYWKSGCECPDNTVTGCNCC